MAAMKQVVSSPGVSWENEWFCSISVVTFDIDVGQVVEQTYPPNQVRILYFHFHLINFYVPFMRSSLSSSSGAWLISHYPTQIMASLVIFCLTSD